MIRISAIIRSIADDVRELGHADTLIRRWWFGTKQAERTARELEEIATNVDAVFAQMRSEIDRLNKALDSIVGNAQEDAEQQIRDKWAVHCAERTGKLTQIYAKRNGHVVRTHHPRCWLRDLKEGAL